MSNTNVSSSQHQKFGLNITMPTRTIQQAKETMGKAISGLWDPVLNYLDENENVFSGNIADQMERANLFSYNLGAAMRAQEKKSKFEMSMR